VTSLARDNIAAIYYLTVDTKSGLISRVTSLEGDNFVAIYYLGGSEV
jgi:hypothetical protein